MSTPNDGGAAFPVPPERLNECGGDRHWAYAHPGMSLRDYLAARCPITMSESSNQYGMKLTEILRGKGPDWFSHMRCRPRPGCALEGKE
jgi:hypothetical protein